VSEFSEKLAPSAGGATDWRAVMSAMGKENALSPSADDPRVVELLTRWDELPDELLGQLERHPVHAARLDHLRHVEAYLSGSTCPEPQELYDFARGPGYGPLPGARRGEVADHLNHCAECGTLVESLEGSPPLPLDLTGDAAPAPRHRPRRPHALPRIVERWLPMAAAAAVLAIGLLVFRGDAVDAGDLWPTYPLLRGEAAADLTFPRDTVLARGNVPGGGWAEAPRFEVGVVQGATAYRFEVARHAGAAFGEGEPVLSLAGASSVLLAAEALEPGHYTWEAWATVDGLERLLGTRDFEVLEVGSLHAGLAHLSDLERVHHLHDAGYWTDARALARHNPPSVGRDTYLGAAPGR